MGRKDRTGEERLNSFGSKMVIKEYRGCNDIDVYFPEYDWMLKNTKYRSFKNGGIKCPYDPSVYGVGYLGEGKYTATENGKVNEYYNIWHDMIKRCYDPKSQKRNPTYKGCEVEDHLLNFQNMAEWLNENYYKIPGETMCLDKDILCKGNKVYSRETCIFVPHRINSLFTKCDKSRGKNPIGVKPLPSGNYYARCRDGYGKEIPLGTYPTKEEAFQAYKQGKEKVIKETIDSYEGIIPEPFYSKLKIAMYNYKVEITD